MLQFEVAIKDNLPVTLHAKIIYHNKTQIDSEMK